MNRIHLSFLFLLILVSGYAQKPQRIAIDKSKGYLYEGKWLGEHRLERLLGEEHLPDAVRVELRKVKACGGLQQTLFFSGAGILVAGSFVSLLVFGNDIHFVQNPVFVSTAGGTLLLETGAWLMHRCRRHHFQQVIELYNQSVLN